jgi:hypothetical protein
MEKRNKGKLQYLVRSFWWLFTFFCILLTVRILLDLLFNKVINMSYSYLREPFITAAIGFFVFALRGGVKESKLF